MAVRFPTTEGKDQALYLAMLAQHGQLMSAFYNHGQRSGDNVQEPNYVTADNFAAVFARANGVNEPRNVSIGVDPEDPSYVSFAGLDAGQRQLMLESLSRNEQGAELVGEGDQQRIVVPLNRFAGQDGFVQQAHEHARTHAAQEQKEEAVYVAQEVAQREPIEPAAVSAPESRAEAAQPEAPKPSLSREEQLIRAPGFYNGPVIENGSNASAKLGNAQQAHRIGTFLDREATKANPGAAFTNGVEAFGKDALADAGVEGDVSKVKVHMAGSSKEAGTQELAFAGLAQGDAEKLVAHINEKYGAGSASYDGVKGNENKTRAYDAISVKTNAVIDMANEFKIGLDGKKQDGPEAAKPAVEAAAPAAAPAPVSAPEQKPEIAPAPAVTVQAAVAAPAVAPAAVSAPEEKAANAPAADNKFAHLNLSGIGAALRGSGVSGDGGQEHKEAGPAIQVRTAEIVQQSRGASIG